MLLFFKPSPFLLSVALLAGAACSTTVVPNTSGTGTGGASGTGGAGTGGAGTGGAIKTDGGTLHPFPNQQVCPTGASIPDTPTCVSAVQAMCNCVWVFADDTCMGFCTATCPPGLTAADGGAISCNP